MFSMCADTHFPLVRRCYRHLPICLYIPSRSISADSHRILPLVLSHCFFSVLSDSFEERTNKRRDLSQLRFDAFDSSLDLKQTRILKNALKHTEKGQKSKKYGRISLTIAVLDCEVKTPSFLLSWMFRRVSTQKTRLNISKENGNRSFFLQVRVLIVIVLEIITHKENDRFPFSFDIPSTERRVLRN